MVTIWQKSGVTDRYKQKNEIKTKENTNSQQETNENVKNQAE